MKTVTTKALPHGAVPFAKIDDPQLRNSMMQINENVRSVAAQLTTLQEAVRELQRKRVDTSGFVEAVEGKGLSTNDYTTAEREKLGGIAVGAQVNVKPDWNAASGNAAEILNKPQMPAFIASFVVTMPYMSSSDSTLTPLFPLSDFGADSSKSYVVQARFYNVLSTSRTCKVVDSDNNESSGVKVTSSNTSGVTASLTMGGGKSFKLDMGYYRGMYAVVKITGAPAAAAPAEE